ncbi:MAG TPA: acyltransferase family protein [Jatrophihabitantaceae bacterium]|nr:acyltransferase family protein [Jatrophihabitantaceae bacterium]
MSQVKSVGTHRVDRASTQAPSGRDFRPDIQGMRALAVLLVVIYHLYPSWLPGGFVGVDVFFVISGYLITAHLAAGYARTGRIRLLEFWGRRARRLLPAAALVLLATWIASRFILPTTRLPATAEQIRASALYFQNWVLVHTSTNYLTAEDAPTPVQHFWSLSIEEQFYLFWPLLFVLAAVVAWRWNRRAGRLLVIGLAAAIVIASLAYSAHETATNPAAAYFVTTTRIWELGAGGLLALVQHRLSGIIARQGWLAWLGLALIIWSAFALSGASAFPGTIAVVPVGGAVLMLACGAPTARWGPAWLTSLRPAVFVGDISYSLYLWHWPMIVLWKYRSGNGIGLLDGPAILAAGILASWLTKRFVEDPIRLAPRIAKYPRRSLATALAVLVPVAVVALYSPPAPYHLKNLDARHPGGAVLAGDAHNVLTAPVEPPIVDAATDMTDDTRCQATIPQTQPRTCITGDTTSPRLRVALVGDSVLGQWRGDLNRIASEQHWELITELHAECPWSATLMFMRSTSTAYPTCHTWGQLALHDMLTKYQPDLVITSSRAVLSTPSHHKADATANKQIADGMVTYWRQLKAAGIGVVAIRDTPEPGANVPDCLSTPGAKASDCAIAASKAIKPDTPLVQAAAQMNGEVDLIDMDDLICARECNPIVGNVEVYRDEHHLTLTYAETLLPYLRTRLLATRTMQAINS